MCALQFALMWCALSALVWWLSKLMARRQIERARAEMEGVRRRIIARKADLMLVLEKPAGMDRERYVMVVNELMHLAQLEAAWRGRAHGNDDDDTAV